ncbi:hypothetical protein [Vibrio sagamiensis]|uniref:Uncharacterized protein n=1 Tax=Vibrio sagamiensis NBRC 104589 TaxID=1219064 RepID=A0A511QKS6_9VIBR|nr:hypothetical protein [Vibrio sagamiensis]PNQ71061.1 hypothetical protein C1141_03145 [Vibrio agarivorans]PNQ71094.1 hypothetical protein C1141_02830 [Vibrio agarivorans]GEM77646.1 hypothetical protein VSA01S_37580 [Vibrio sagamiensis NBRC 104589]
MSDVAFVLDEQEEITLLDIEPVQSNQQKETMTVPAYEFLQRCHLPLYFRARIRELRLGDTFFMGSIRKKYDAEDIESDGIVLEGFSEVYVRKERGGYKLFATWAMIESSSTPYSAFSVEFKLERGNFIFKGRQLEAQLKGICLVSRLIQRLIKGADNVKLEDFTHLNTDPFFMGVRVDKNRVFFFDDGIYKKSARLLPEEMMPITLAEHTVNIFRIMGMIGFYE